MKAVVCSSDKVKGLVELKASGKLKTLTNIMYFDELKPNELDAAKSSGLILKKFNDIIIEGKTIKDPIEFK